jgi:2,4-dienoyl-CoA reductase-like NADH-dependent reductase (Old Yellow Enzyme family)
MDDPKSREGNGAGRAAEMDRLVEMLDRGDFDLVAVGRAALADPAWASKVREGRYSELKPFSLDALKTLF